MNIQLPENITRWSTWALLTFAGIVLLGAFISELFQAPRIGTQEFSESQFLFKKEDLENINKIILKNRLGLFNFDKSIDENHPGWNLTYPRKLPANPSGVKAIVQGLSKIKIRKTYPKDAINITNFSLNAPVVELNLESGQQKIELKIGIVNPIDNSTYVTRSDSNSIFYVDALDTPLEMLDLAFFIDTGIFSFAPDRLLSLKIYRGLQKHNDVIFALTYSPETKEWKDKSGRVVNEEKITSFFDDLFELKSIAILDRVSDKLRENLDKYLAAPQFTLVLENQDNSQTTYLVTPVITKQLPDVKIEKKLVFIIQASNRENPYAFDQKDIEIFRPNLAE
ncbi:MAG: DUF4340 domain-containing protein [Pseudomonadota bacterium]